ncbi:MAG: hypothetical protein GOU98_02780 [Candidatus Altiarchaeota archaeon]|nr:hypothetical protein [Candidatus Altiarchaeota archaeon]
MFIDVYSGFESSEKLLASKKLDIKIAPGDYSLLISKNKSEIRKKRSTTNFVSAKPKTKQEMNKLLTDTFYDFLIIEGFNLGKRNVRMAKRYETPLAIPISSAFSLKQSDLNRLRKNFSMVLNGGVAFLICSGAKLPEELRGGFELASIGIFFGVPHDLSINSIKKIPQEILSRNEKRLTSEVWKK